MVLDIDRSAFESFLEDTGDTLYDTSDVSDCPLACYLSSDDVTPYVTKDRVIMAGRGPRKPRLLQAYELPDWAQRFSALDKVATGHEFAAILRKL